MDPTMTLESMNTTQGSKDPNSRALGPKSHADMVFGQYLRPWTLRVGLVGA